MYGYEDEAQGQTERLSERLSNLTYWGDYGGDIINRFHYETLLTEYPDAVKVQNDHYGQSLVLNPGGKYLVEVIRFIAFFDPASDTYGGYPLYWDDDFYMFEEECAWKEISAGWWGEYELRELHDWLGDWDNTLFPETQAEFASLIQDFNQADDWNHWEIEWETASSLVVRGYDREKLGMWLLERYSRSLTEAGNPDALI